MAQARGPMGQMRYSLGPEVEVPTYTFHHPIQYILPFLTQIETMANTIASIPTVDLNDGTSIPIVSQSVITPT